MSPNIGDAMYNIHLYDAIHSILARSQAPGALRTTHTLSYCFMEGSTQRGLPILVRAYLFKI